LRQRFIQALDELVAQAQELKMGYEQQSAVLAQGCAAAQFEKPRHNCAANISNGANAAMSSTTDLLNGIQASGNGLTLAELLTEHPGIARRTA